MTAASGVWAVILFVGGGATAGFLLSRYVRPRQRAEAVAIWSMGAATIVVVALQVEASLELLGAVERMRIYRPALLTGLAAAVTAGGGLPRHGGVRGRVRDLPTYLRWLIAITASVYLLFLVVQVTGYPSSWDGVSYHLPLAVDWLQSGSLSVGEGSGWRSALPGNGELLMMAALATGWQAAGELYNLVPLIGLVAACWLLLAAVEVRLHTRVATVAIICAVPIILFQSFSAYVDLTHTAWLAVAAAVSVNAFSTSRQNAGPSGFRVRLVLCGLAIGLAIGTKPIAWPYALFLILVIGYAFFRRRRDGRPQTCLTALLFIAAVGVPCIFWFARNLAATGNPLYPFAVEFIGIELTPGVRPSTITPAEYESFWVDSKFDWLFYPWTESKNAGYNYSTGSGLGPLFAAFVPIGVLYTAWRTLAHRPSWNQRLAGGLLFFTVVFISIWWLIMSRLPRFALPIIVLLCLAAAPLLDDLLCNAKKLVAPLLLMTSVVFAFVASLPQMQILAGRVKDGEWTRHEFYRIPKSLDQLPARSIVVNLNRSTEWWNNFALAGARLQNQVVPYWRASEVVTEIAQKDSCRVYIVEHTPFGTVIDSTLLRNMGLRVNRDMLTSAGRHSPKASQWRIWQPSNCL